MSHPLFVATLLVLEGTYVTLLIFTLLPEVSMAGVYLISGVCHGKAVVSLKFPSWRE